MEGAIPGDIELLLCRIEDEVDAVPVSTLDNDHTASVREDKDAHGVEVLLALELQPCSYRFGEKLDQGRIGIHRSEYIPAPGLAKELASLDLRVKSLAGHVTGPHGARHRTPGASHRLGGFLPSAAFSAVPLFRAISEPFTR